MGDTSSNSRYEPWHHDLTLFGPLCKQDAGRIGEPPLIQGGAGWDDRMSAPPRAGKDGTSFAVKLALLGFLILTALQVVRHSLLLRVREEARGDEREAFDRYEGQGEAIIKMVVTN
jgi:hypothetical protein